MSFCDAREANASVVCERSGGDMRDLVTTMEQPIQACWASLHTGFEEGAVDDQLTAALEQIEQAHFALGPSELVILLQRQPRHPPRSAAKRVTGAGQSFSSRAAVDAQPPTPALKRSVVSSFSAPLIFSLFICFANFFGRNRRDSSGG